MKTRTYPIYIGAVTLPESARSGLARIGDRVEAHPACDSWMMGDRFGAVVKLGFKYIHVKMDRSGRIRKFLPRDLMTAG